MLEQNLIKPKAKIGLNLFITYEQRRNDIIIKNQPLNYYKLS